MGNKRSNCPDYGAAITVEQTRCEDYYPQERQLLTPSEMTENLTKQLNQAAAYFSNQISLKCFKGFFYFGILSILIGAIELFNDRNSGIEILIFYLLWTVIFYFLIIIQKNKIASEQEIDQLHQVVVNQVIKKIFSEEKQVNQRIAQPIQLDDYDLDKRAHLRLVKGKDGRVRSSQYQVASIQFYQEYLAIYTYHFSLLKNEGSASFIQVPYSKITAATSIVQAYIEMDWRGKKQEIPIEQLFIQGEKLAFLEMTLQGENIGHASTKIKQMIQQKSHVYSS
ncbi:hypothetical protein [Isobaculum melis]|nr:hypothetical protein [Isobaculum melis]